MHSESSLKEKRISLERLLSGKKHPDFSNISDKLQPRNINVSFTNNSNVAIDVIILTFYSDQLTIDVEAIPLSQGCEHSGC